MKPFVTRNTDGYRVNCIAIVEQSDGTLQPHKVPVIAPELSGKALTAFLTDYLDSIGMSFVKVVSVTKVHVHGEMDFNTWLDNATITITEYDDESEDNN